MGIGIVPAILLWLLFSLWVTFSCILSDDPSPSPLVSLFTQKLPRIFLSIVKKIAGEKGVKVIRKLSEKFLAIVYLVIVLGTWSIMFTYGYTFITRSPHVSSNHKACGYLVFVVCMWSWNKAHTTSPGYIVERNIPRFDNYPYDDLLYVDRDCPTLGFRKLARSKYDRFTNRHVARFDHFCGWIDNSVGEENYRFFLLFLAVHVAMCIYGTYVTFYLFLGEIVDKNLMNAIFYNSDSGKEVAADRIVIAHYMFMKHPQVTGALILLGAMAVVLGLFLAFHLYIAANGMTTNEYYKWRQVKKWHKKETAKYRAAVEEGMIQVQEMATMANSNSNKQEGMGELPDVDVGCVGPSKNGDSNRLKRDNGDRDGDEDENEKMMGIIDPGPFPQNIYNLGMKENFRDIIFPRSLRPDARAKVVRKEGTNDVVSSKTKKSM